MPYGFLRVITIDHTKVGSTLTNYPVLVNSTLSGLRTVGNGGDVQNINGYDITFISDINDPASLLDWEVEKYDPTTGLIIAWVRLPTVSPVTDTVFYLQYGNAAISTFQGDVAGTWQTAFKGVWHMPGDELDIIPPDLTDSTSNNNDGSATGFSNQHSIPYQIGGGCSYSGGGDGVTCGTGASLAVESFSLSGWFTPTGVISAFSRAVASKSGDLGVTSGWAVLLDSTGKIRFQYYDGSARQYFSVAIVFADNAKHFLSFTWDQAAGQFTVYKDGALVESVVTTTGTISYSSDIFYIGGPVAAAYQGKLDEIRVYSGVQSAGWVLTEYNNEFSPSTFYTISAVSTPFTASCGDPPDGTAGVLYTHTFPTPTDGGLAPFFFALLTRDRETYVPEDVINNITLNGLTGEWSGYPAAPGTYQFTLDVFDFTSREEFVDCEITIGGGTPPSPPVDWLPVPPVDPPDGWNFTSNCARTGNTGLSHTADGTVAGSNARVVSQTPVTVEAGWLLYVSLWVKQSGGADGTIGCGFMFYDVDDVFLSEEYVNSTGAPTVFTEFKSTITVPTGAVSAIPVVQVIDHLVDNSIWCIDDLLSFQSGGHFVLSSIKSYYSQFISYR